MKPLEALDPNFRLNDAVPKDFLFRSPQEAPFAIYGLVPNAQGSYCRLPLDFLPECSAGVQSLAFHLAGGCIRFATDSPALALVWRLKGPGGMAHFTPCGQSGMELFEEREDGAHQVHNFLPQLQEGGVCRLPQSGYTQLPSGMRSYALYLPLYNGLDELLLGFAPGAVVVPGRVPGIAAPIVFYGSSITQGGCASKCGSCYTHLVSRRLDAAHVNLGFAGNAKGEEGMARYIAGLTMSAFVMDYDHNAPDEAHLARTHEPFFRIIRQAQPKLPILLLSKPNTDKAPDLAQSRMAVIRRTFERAKAEGDTRVWLIEGHTLFGSADRDLCTVDGCHPTDLGFLRMADAITPVLREMLMR